MSLAVGTSGVSVYQPAGGVSRAPFSSLCGRPVIPIEQCKTLGTTGDIYLADLSGYAMITKAAQAAWSAHIRFVFDERVFRLTFRIDGQPVLASAITPANSTDTLSHFIKLDSRT